MATDTYYDIIVSYETGDTFTTETLFDVPVGIVTRDIKKAETNVERIKQHYADYEANNLEDNEIHTLQLLTDENDGNGTRIICPFWCGYFETLISVDINPVSKTTHHIFF